MYGLLPGSGATTRTARSLPRRPLPPVLPAQPGRRGLGRHPLGARLQPDLVTGTDHGVALAPTPGSRDELGAWSGCAVVEDGVPEPAVYTGMDRRDGIGSVMIARAVDDAIGALKADPEPVVPGTAPGPRPPRVPRSVPLHPRRPPLGARRSTAIAGPVSATSFSTGSTRSPSGPTQVRSSTPPTRSPGTCVAAQATAWECPALLPAGDGRWILLVSLWTDDITYSTAYLIGDLREAGEGLRFVPGSGGMLDDGRDFYAPTALVERDRTLMSWLELGVPHRAGVRRGQLGQLPRPIRARSAYTRTGRCASPRRPN